MGNSLPLLNVAIPFGLAVIMFGLGLNLSVTDFVNLLKRPKPAVFGLFSQLFFFPLMAFALVKVLPVSPEVGLGLVLLASCPGGATSNLFTHLAGGVIALSVSLTAISSIVTVFTIPLILGVTLESFGFGESPISLSFGKMMLQLVLLTWVPISMGMVTRKHKPTLVPKMDGWVKRFSVVFLVLLISLVILKERYQFGMMLRQAGLGSMLLNAIALGIGGIGGWVLRLDFKERVTVALEVGVQNGAMAILIASSPLMLNNGAVAVGPAIYSLLMYGFAFAVVAYSQKVLRDG